MKKILILILILSVISSPVMAHSITAFGGLTSHDDGATPVTLPGVGVWFSANRLNSSRRENMGFDAGGLVIQVNGTYQITGHGSFQAVGGGGEYAISVLIDGIIPADMGCHTHVSLSGSGISEPVSFSCYQDLNQTNNITIGIRDEDAPLRSILGMSAGLTVRYESDQNITALPSLVNRTNIKFNDLRLGGGNIKLFYGNGSFIGEIGASESIFFDNSQEIHIHFEPTIIDLISESTDPLSFVWGYSMQIFIFFIVILFVIIIIGGLIVMLLLKILQAVINHEH